MTAPTANSLVHLELHTRDAARASAFYAELCGWPTERIEAGNRAYLSLGLGGVVGGGIVDCHTSRSLWLPYVETSQICAATERARELGASVLLEPREGPAGWRSVVAAPAGAEIAFWQPKR